MRSLLFLIPLLIITGSCKKNKTAPIRTPYKTSLLYPANNEACLTGTTISSTQNSIQFKWNKAVYADSYDLVVKNLETSVINTYPSSGNQLDITLLSNAPYSWYVISKSSTSPATAQSDVWKFYNSGAARLFYAPFPADIIAPTMGANVKAIDGKIILDWDGTDADNDITSYDVYLGTNIAPVLLVSNVAASILADVPVTGNTVYYWKVITRDSKGNTSDSGLYQFKVN